MAGKQKKNPSSKINGYAFRLLPHTDLRKGIQQFAITNAIKAGAILTAVGSLEQFNIRYANQKEGRVKRGFFEIVSLTGTFSENACHLHISVADNKGRTYGGHLLDDNLIYTTAEIVLFSLGDLQFGRTTDRTYNFKELVVRRKPK